MKNMEDIEKIIEGRRDFLRENFNINKIGIFGSYARGEETEKSDLDILVNFSKPIGWEFIDLKDFLEEILGRKVDLVTTKALKSQLRDKILKEVVYI